MSFIIDDPKTNYFHNLSKRKRTKQKQQREIAEKSVKKSDISQQLNNCLKQKIQVYCLYRIKTFARKIVILQPIHLFEHFYVVLTFIVDGEKRSPLKLRIDVIDHSQSYFNAGSYQKRITLNKLFYLNQKMVEKYLIKLSINMHSGRITMNMPFHVFGAEDQLFSLSFGKKRNFVNKLIAQTLIETKNLVGLLLIFVEGSQHIHITKELNQFQSFRAHKIDSLHRYQQMLMVKRRDFDQPQNKDKKFIKQVKLKYEQSVAKLAKFRVETDKHMTKNMVLFQQHKSNYKQLVKESQFKIEEEQRQHILRLINQPILSKANSPEDSTIYIKDPNNLRLAPINSGGFANIFITTIEYWPTQPPKKANVPTMHKHVVIKKQNPQEISRGRNLHEKLIVSKLKGSPSILFNTYYTASNKPNIFQSDVIMDYIPFPNLSEYVKQNKSTLSTHTKIHLMFMLVQALRVIKENDVVHADVKPSNVLLYCGLFIKLIDFGESYHPQVCNKNYRPGFSIPYSSPEVHRLPCIITDKSDIFSMATIFLQLLQGSVPFYFSNEYALKRFKTDEYLSRWFFSPEEGNINEDIILMPLLIKLISQCLHSEASQRPELSLVSLLLRQCLQVLN